MHDLRNACLTCSFQAEDMVVLHQLRQQRADIPVLFLDTGYHFPETLAYRDRMAAEWNLNLTNLRNPLPLDHLYTTDPTACCHARKVEPLAAGLEPFDVWFTGLRREQSPTRRNLQIEEDHRLPSGKTLRKISPLALWTTKEVFAYTVVNEIPLLPLYEQGYPSIGCAPCTQKPVNPDDPRSGRWAGQKLECGIHTFTK
jgi:phosphoadenosine phosphosulfate reductase